MSPSGGVTLGFWSNKNGNKILTGSPTGNGTTLLSGVVTLLNSCQLRNANGTIHTFTNSYSAFKSWLLGATATNMAYMLPAELAALKLDVYFNFVDGNAFDLCSSSKVNGLISPACDQLAMDGNTVSRNPTRLAQETLKNCIRAANNNGPVVPVTPCSYTFPNPPAPCPYQQKHNNSPQLEGCAGNRGILFLLTTIWKRGTPRNTRLGKRNAGFLILFLFFPAS
jgi:hypothetical protein